MKEFKLEDHLSDNQIFWLDVVLNAFLGVATGYIIGRGVAEFFIG